MFYFAVGGVFDYAYRLTECFEPHVRLPVSVPHYKQSSGRRRDFQSKIVYYLGLHVDNKLNWKYHIIKKRKQMDLRYRELYWLLWRKYRLSVDNKLQLYKSIITPIWTYDIDLWGCACKSNITVIQRCQSIILRAIVDDPWYVTNDMIHKDLGIPAVQEVIHERRIKHLTNLESHFNPLLQPLPRDNVVRRLKRRWPADLYFRKCDSLLFCWFNLYLSHILL